MNKGYEKTAHRKRKKGSQIFENMFTCSYNKRNPYKNCKNTFLCTYLNENDFFKRFANTEGCQEHDDTRTLIH